jgi:hypothetical protein
VKLTEPIVVDDDELRATARHRFVGRDDRLADTKAEEEEIFHRGSRVVEGGKSP